MFSRYKPWLREYSVGIAWSLAFAALLLVAILSYVNFQKLARTAELVNRQYEILLELEFIVASLTDAETGQRGFVITGKTEYLEPYARAVAALPEHLARIEDFFQTDLHQMRRFRLAEQQVARRLEELQTVIDLRKQQGFAAVQQRLLENRGKLYMDGLRGAIVEMKDHERLTLDRRRNEADQGRQNAGLILVSGTLVLAAMTVAAFLVTHRQIAYRRAMERRLTATNEELEQRVLHRTDALRATNESLRDEILERARLEEQAKMAAEELNRSNKELEQFAFVASHDLQEPLRKIQAFSDRLKTRYADRLDDQGKEYLERIVVSADRMRLLINDLLTYSRVSTHGKEFATVDLNVVVKEVVADLEGRLLQTSGQVEQGPLPTVLADAPQMRQVFQNLIANGLKFHRPDAPPLVRIAARTIPPVDGQPQRCEITVADNGIGFENIYAERIFQLFQRLHGRSEYEGTGMGLAISRKIVERHGGTLTAAGVPGQGATFTISLPTPPASPQE